MCSCFLKAPTHNTIEKLHDLKQLVKCVYNITHWAKKLCESREKQCATSMPLMNSRRNTPKL